MNQPKQKEWEEKFDEFGELYQFPFMMPEKVLGFYKALGKNPIVGRAMSKPIKDFFRSVLKEVEEELYFKPRENELECWKLCRKEQLKRNELIKEIRRKLVAETTIGEHTMVVFDDIVSSLDITQAIKKVGDKKK